MFELFSRTLAAKRPILTKLDDDGETQMDMCKSTALRSLTLCARLWVLYVMHQTCRFCRRAERADSLASVRSLMVLRRVPPKPRLYAGVCIL